MFLNNYKGSKFNSIKVLIFFYLVFITITVLFCFLNIIKLSSVSGSQENQYFQENLKSTKYSIEDEMANVKSVIDQLSNSRCVADVLSLSDSNPNLLNDQPYDIYTTVVELRNLNNNSKLIEHIGIFIKSSNMVIDNNSSYNAFDYYNSIFKLENVDTSRWYGLTDGFQNFFIMPSDKVSLNDHLLEGFTYIKTIPPNNIGSKGVIFAMVKKSQLTSVLNSMDFDINASGAILDEKNNIVVTSKNYKNVSLPDYNQFSTQDFITSGDNEYSFIAMPLKNLPWKLVLVKNNKFDSWLSYLGLNTILALVVILILGIFVSMLLNKFYSGTLNAILDSINYYISDKKDPVLNLKKIYKMFEYKFKILINEISSLNEVISQYKDIIKNSILTSVPRPSERLEYYGMLTALQNEMFIDSQAFMIFFYIQDLKRNNNKLKSYIHLTNFLKKSNLKSHSIENLDSYEVFLGYLNQTQLQYYDEIHERIITYVKELEIEYDILIHIAFSPLCSSIEMLIASYKTLSHTFKAQLTLGTYCNFQCINTLQTQNIIEFLPVSKENRILRHLKSGAADEVEMVLKDLINSSIHDINSGDLNSRMILFHELFALVIRYIQEEKSNLDIPHIDYNLIKNFDDIILLLKQLCFIRKDSESKEDNDTQTVDQKSEILKFIDENFLDNSLCLKIIKDRFNVSLSLITKAVKEMTGDGFLDYLNKKRIKHAKKLLLSTDMTISKARGLSGYNDDSVFIKVFKKYEGKTPGEYKKKAQSK